MTEPRIDGVAGEDEDVRLPHTSTISPNLNLVMELLRRNYVNRHYERSFIIS